MSWTFVTKMVRGVDAKSLYFAALTGLRLDRPLLTRVCRRGWTPVINLHRVSPDDNPFWSPLHPRVFEDLLRRLMKRFDIVSLAELTEASRRRPRARPALVLSFDDGYHDFLEYAVPILDRLRLPSNQNVIPDVVESGIPPWNILLYDFLNAAPLGLINEIRLPGFQRRLTSTDARSKALFGLALARHLKLRSKSEREAMWPGIQAAIDRMTGLALTRMMSRQDVIEFSQRPGCVVGAHAYAHDSMGFESDDFFTEDLERCVAYFREKLNLPLTVYAFPNGSWRPSQVKLLEARGFDRILLVEEKLSTGRSTVVPRLTINGSTAPEAYFRALGYGAGGAS